MFDTVGRVLAGIIMLKSPVVCMILTILRSGHIVVAFLSAYNISIFENDYVRIANIVLCSISLGYVVNSQVIMG